MLMLLITTAAAANAAPFEFKRERGFQIVPRAPTIAEMIDYQEMVNKHEESWAWMIKNSTGMKESIVSILRSEEQRKRLLRRE